MRVAVLFVIGSLRVSDAPRNVATGRVVGREE